MCALMSFYTPIDYESVRTVSIFGFSLHYTFDGHIQVFTTTKTHIISPRIILCSGIHTNNEITKPNEDEIREDGNSGISTNIETYVSCCI